VVRATKFRLAFIAVVGGALALYMLMSIGFKPILVAASAVGWGGFASLCIYQVGQFVVLGIAWCALVPASCRARPRVFIWARMVRDATSELLPFSHLGGIVLGAKGHSAWSAATGCVWIDSDRYHYRNVGAGCIYNGWRRDSVDICAA